MVLYWTLEPRLVGQENSRLFFFTAIAYFLFAAVSIPTLRRRWPDRLVQTAFNVERGCPGDFLAHLLQRRHEQRPRRIAACCR